MGQIALRFIKVAAGLGLGLYELIGVIKDSKSYKLEKPSE